MVIELVDVKLEVADHITYILFLGLEHFYYLLFFTAF